MRAIAVVIVGGRTPSSVGELTERHGSGALDGGERGDLRGGDTGQIGLAPESATEASDRQPEPRRQLYVPEWDHLDPVGDSL